MDISLSKSKQQKFWLKIYDATEKWQGIIDEHIIVSIASTALAFVFKRFGTGLIVMVAVRVALRLLKSYALKQQHTAE